MAPSASRGAAIIDRRYSLPFLRSGPASRGRGQPPRRSSTEASDASLFLKTEPGRGTLSNARQPKAFGTTPDDNRNVALTVKFPNRRRALTVLCGLELVAGNLDCAVFTRQGASRLTTTPLMRDGHERPRKR